MLRIHHLTFTCFMFSLLEILEADGGRQADMISLQITGI